MHDRLVQLDILYKPTHKVYSIIGTYFSAQNSEKDNFLGFLSSFLRNIHHPWLLLLGDFNKILLHQYKIGGAPIKSSQLQRLPQLIKLMSQLISLVIKKLSLGKECLTIAQFMKDLIEPYPTKCSTTTSISAD